MRFTRLKEVPTSRDYIDVFGGYNRNLRAGENEFYDMKNMCSDFYPVLAARSARVSFGGSSYGGKITGIINKNGPCFSYGTRMHMASGYEVDMGLTADKKQLVSMGSYIIILPDKKWINSVITGSGTHEWGEIENRRSASAFTLSLCTLDGADYPDNIASNTEPKNPENGQYWIDTSKSPNELNRWSEASAMWVGVATTYVKISAAGIGEGFKQYDGVNISGTSVVDGARVVYKCDKDYIVVVGMLDEVKTKSTGITVERTMPDMDFVVESGNRLFGCKYGYVKNNFINEIYACKLGDFKNWMCNMGISTDSYQVSLGSDGYFTGAITYQGYPHFFKEGVVHRIYGTMPSNFQTQSTPCRGVERNSEKSLAIVDDILYYNSSEGIVAYDGSSFNNVSEKLGKAGINNVVGGALGGKYYAGFYVDGKPSLMAFDTRRGMWHKEDDLDVTDFCTGGDNLYYLTKDAIGVGGIPLEHRTESGVEWLLETGLIGASTPDRKYLTRLTVRLSAAIGTNISFKIQYDSSGDWQTINTLTCNSLRSFAIPIRPHRCDHLRLRIEGKGDVKFYSISKTLEEGSDRW